MTTGLYIHVPFCIRKCPYCDFYSLPYNNGSMEAEYEKSVIQNILLYIEKYPEINFDTVYFGGGTPSLMSVRFYEKVLSIISSKCDTSSAEITIEMNPGTAENEKLLALRRAGINRISFGVQSLSDYELSMLGRIHNAETAVSAIKMAYECGFENISADLMIGIKGQNIKSLAYSIDTLARLPLKHISAYMLKIEEGTEYYYKKMSEQVPGDDETADMYLFTIKRLAEKGFMQYEISNFSKIGYESRHNLRYWHCDSYIGIGPSAHSFFNGIRYEVPGDLKKFIEDKKQTEIVNDLNPGGFFERAMLQLRLNEGLDIKKYPDFADKILKKAFKYVKTGLVINENNVIKLTPEGFMLSNMIISDILLDIDTKESGD